MDEKRSLEFSKPMLYKASTSLRCTIWVADGSLRCHAPEVRFLAVLGSQMQWNAWRLTEHAATIQRALPLGMHLRHLAYSKKACSSALKSPLKFCKSTVRQESSGEEINVGFFVFFVAVPQAF